MFLNIISHIIGFLVLFIGCLVLGGILGLIIFCYYTAYSEGVTKAEVLKDIKKGAILYYNDLVRFVNYIFTKGNKEL